MNFDLYLDGLSILFSLLITGIGSLVVLYSIGYLSKSEQLGNFYCYLLLFMGAMLGVVLSDNLIILYLFWELTSFSSFYLSLSGEKKGIYLWCTKVINHYRIWWIKFIRGFILISLAGDSLSLHELIANASEIQHSPLFIFAMVLIMLVHSLNLHKFHFIFGCLTLWKHLPSQCISTLGNNGESRIIFSCSCYMLLRYHKDGFGQLL